MEAVSGKEFNGERIVLDGKSFTDCRFIGCVFIFEGTDTFVLDNCSVSNDTAFTLSGAAELTMQRMHVMLHSTGWMAGVAQNLLKILETPPVFEK